MENKKRKILFLCEGVYCLLVLRMQNSKSQIRNESETVLFTEVDVILQNVRCI
jgi:hypothetical protein